MTTHDSASKRKKALDSIQLDAADAVIFDFNGTLSDDEGLLLELLDDVVYRHLGRRVRPEEYSSRFLGRSDRDIVEALVRDAAVPSVKVTVDALLGELVSLYVASVSTTPRISRGARELVEALVGLGLPLAIVTGARREAVLPALEFAGLGKAFDAVVTDRDVVEGKPHPEGLLLASQMLGAPVPARTVVFEDSVPGLRAAAAAGMHSVAVRGSASEVDLSLHASLVVDALVPELVTTVVPSR